MVILCRINGRSPNKWGFLTKCDPHIISLQMRNGNRSYVFKFNDGFSRAELDVTKDFKHCYGIHSFIIPTKLELLFHMEKT